MLAFAAALAVSLLGVEPQVPSISLEEAVRRAEGNPSVLAAAEGRIAARAQVDQAWPSHLPSLSVQANVLVYNDEQVFSLVSSDEPIDCTGIPDPFGSLCLGFSEPTVVREQVTSSVTVRAVLPLTGQFAVASQVEAAKVGARAAEASVDAAVAEARFMAADAWYGAAQTEQQLAIAQAQVRSLEGRVATARIAREAGNLTPNDLLLAQISLSQARQVVVQWTALRDSAYGRLGLAIGNGGAPVRPEESAERPPRWVPEVEAMISDALERRSDLRALRMQWRGAVARATAVSLSLFPSIAAMGAWQHQEGQGVFGEPDTVYVGVTLDWNVLEAGRTLAGVRAARALARQLRHQVEGAEAGIRLEVRARVQTLATATAAWGIASEMLAQAEESLHIQERRQATGSATMQEVLDAEVALIRAQLGRSSALSDAWRAEAALERAVGGDPWGR